MDTDFIALAAANDPAKHNTTSTRTVNTSLRNRDILAILQIFVNIYIIVVKGKIVGVSTCYKQGNLLKYYPGTIHVVLFQNFSRILFKLISFYSIDK